MLLKTSTQINLEALRWATWDAIKKYDAQWTQSRQIGLTCRPGAKDRVADAVGSLYDYNTQTFIGNETDYSEFVSEFKDTYFEEIYSTMPFKISRMRLLGLPSRQGYSVHADREYRYHIAITTNPHCTILFSPTISG